MNQIPVGVQEILHAYFEWFERELPNLLEAFYVYGSISIGAFQEGASDIDFIALIKRKWTEEESIRIKTKSPAMFFVSGRKLSRRRGISPAFN